MTSFIAKKLSAQKNLPEVLKAERQKSNLTLDELSLQTQVSVKYLEALENGDYHLLPGDIYTHEFLKKISKYFHLNEKSLYQIYQAEKNSQLVLPTFRIQTNSSLNGHWLSVKNFRTLLAILVLMALTGYFGWEIKNIYTPPALIVSSPASETVTTNSTMEITGQTEPEAAIAINQEKILASPDGSFNQTVNLTVGLNVFKISTSKKHSKENSVTISILRESTVSGDLNRQDQTLTVF
ncbi:MAG: helix-turn-helix domain-containing protein [Patescibacteria group bacterium]|jgi:cytoskeletal protein RodZ